MTHVCTCAFHPEFTLAPIRPTAADLGVIWGDEVANVEIYLNGIREPKVFAAHADPQHGWIGIFKHDNHTCTSCHKRMTCREKVTGAVYFVMKGYNPPYDWS